AAPRRWSSSPRSGSTRRRGFTEPCSRAWEARSNCGHETAPALLPAPEGYAPLCTPPAARVPSGRLPPAELTGQLHQSRPGRCLVGRGGACDRYSRSVLKLELDAVRFLPRLLPDHSGHLVPRQLLLDDPLRHLLLLLRRLKGGDLRRRAGCDRT